MKLKKSTSKTHIIIICLYGLVLTALLTGIGNIYGHKTDWLSQHIVFPDTFRQYFYDNNTLLPNFFFNIGGGQNAFNFTYYGFLSPGILLSYLFPFVDMTVYIIIFSVISYHLCGVFAYIFLKSHFSPKKAFASAIIFLTLPPLTNHFHHHIMFVWYIPFFILSLIGLDKYFEKNKMCLFILSSFLMIMTNYYFSVSALFFLFVYAIYRILQHEYITLNYFLKHTLTIVFIFLLPVLLSAFLLLPTAYALLTNARIYTSNQEILSLFIPKCEQYFYTHQGMGISGLMLFAVFGNLSCKNKSPANIFLNIFAVLVVTCPLFTYLLNGMLYVRGKVMISFSVIFLYLFCCFINHLSSKEINIKLTAILYVGYVIFSVFITTNLFFAVMLIFELTLFFIIKNKSKFVYISTVIIVLIATVAVNSYETFVSIDYYKQMNYSETTKLSYLTPDGFYRTNVSFQEYDNANRIYGKNFNSTSVYSSTSNRMYQDFYENYMGNNEKYRNCFIVSGTKNELFYVFTGTKYIIGENDPGFYYDEIAKGEKLNLYESKYAYPIAYKSTNIISNEKFDKLQFPYTAECLMNYTVTNKSNIEEYQTAITPCNIKENYKFKEYASKNYSITLAENYRNKILYLSFDILNEGEYLNENDISITINDIQNKLTDCEWLYYNGNTNFQYVIPLENTTKLNIEISKGFYNIQNTKMYISDMIYKSYQPIENLKINKQNQTITCNINSVGEEYLVTSIPYDKGFTAYINGEEAEIEIVNKAFVGIKLLQGENYIKITYHSPFLFYGFLISITTLLLLLTPTFLKIIVILIRKYREILMYLIFGFLTTCISIVTYILCSVFLFNTNNTIELQAANIVSWILSILFAYATNKKFVFKSSGSHLKEMPKFLLSRIGTLFIDMALMHIFVTLYSFNDVLAKTAVQFIVIALNYVFIKALVFKEGKNC